MTGTFQSAVLAVLPIVVILVTSFSNNAFAAFPPETWTLNWYKALFADGSKWPAALSLSALVAALSTVFSLIIGVTAATALVRSELPLRSAVFAEIRILPSSRQIEVTTVSPG